MKNSTLNELTTQKRNIVKKKIAILAALILVASVAVSLIHFLPKEKIDDEPLNAQLQAKQDIFVYAVGEQIDFSTLNFVLINGVKERGLSQDELIIDTTNVDFNTPNTYDLKVSLKENEEISTMLSLIVISSRLEITNYPKVVLIGENYDTSSILAFEILNNGGKKKITQSLLQFDFSLVDKDKAGKYPVTIKYNQKNIQCEIEIEVIVDPNAIVKIDAENYKTNFSLGEEFSLGNIEVYKHFGNGTKNTIATEDYIVNAENFDKTQSGTYFIELIFKDNQNIKYIYQVEVS